MKLTLKFNLVLSLLFIAGISVSGVLSWKILQNNAQREVIERAGLMMEGATAIRWYTINEIKPLLTLPMKKVFLPQSVPAYGATKAFAKLREKYPEYTYKEATLNPTNLENRTVDWESDIVQYFRNNPKKQELTGVRDTPTGKSLYLARPMVVDNVACLVCHSTPDVAPKTMIARYGSTNGFGWKINETIGARIVSVPASLPFKQAKKAFTAFMGSFAAVLVVIFIMMNLMLRYIVIRPVRKMSQIADEVSKGNTEIPEIPSKGRDEMSILASSFNRMRRSLTKAMEMLEKE